jgi:hypothetical protein
MSKSDFGHNNVTSNSGCRAFSSCGKIEDFTKCRFIFCAPDSSPFRRNANVLELYRIIYEMASEDILFLESKSIRVVYDADNMSENPICLTGNILEKAYPKLGEKSNFYSQIVTELFDLGLIRDSVYDVIDIVFYT